MDLTQLVGPKDDIPIGATISRIYTGDTITDSQGRIFAASTAVKIDYDSRFAALKAMAPHFVGNATVANMPFPMSSSNLRFFGTGAKLLCCPRSAAINAVAVSTDNGQTWTYGTLPSAISTQGMDAHWNGSQWLIYLDSSTTAYTSPDGLTWAARACTSISSPCISWNSMYLVVGSGTTSTTSIDNGVSWSSRTMAASVGATGLSQAHQSLYVAWVAALTKWVASAQGSATDPAIVQTSPDGINWTKLTTTDPRLMFFGTSPRWVLTDGTKVVVISTSASVVQFASSTDLANWTFGRMPAGLQHINVSSAWFDGARFCVNNGPITYGSSDLLNWSAMKCGQLTNSLSDTRLNYLGGTSVLISPNAVGSSLAPEKILYYPDYTSATETAIGMGQVAINSTIPLISYFRIA